MPEPDFDALRHHARLAADVSVREAVVRRGLARRRRAGGVAAVAVAATASLALLLPGGTTKDALLPPEVAGTPSEAPSQPVVEPDQSLALALPSPAARRSEPSAPPAGPAQADAAAARAPRTGQTRAGAPAPPAAQASGAPGAPVQRGPYAAMTRTRRNERVGNTCPGGEQRLPDGGSSCPRDNPFVGEPEDGVRALTFQSCQFDDGGPRRLRFATEEEVVLTVRDASDRVVWRWRPERPYSTRPHEDELAPGSCLTWSTTWAHVDDSGQPVPRGVYVLFVDYLELDDDFVHRNTFTY